MEWPTKHYSVLHCYMASTKCGSSGIWSCPSACYEGMTALILNPLNAKLNSICHLLALLGAHHIFHISRIRVNLDIRGQ